MCTAGDCDLGWVSQNGLRRRRQQQRWCWQYHYTSSVNIQYAKTDNVGKSARWMGTSRGKKTINSSHNSFVTILYIFVWVFLPTLHKQHTANCARASIFNKGRKRNWIQTHFPYILCSTREKKLLSTGFTTDITINIVCYHLWCWCCMYSIATEVLDSTEEKNEW